MNQSMQLNHYNAIARALHWLVAGLIVAQYVLIELVEIAADKNQITVQLGLLANHKSIGITILAIAFMRLAWRFTHRPPSLPESMSLWQRTASDAAHWLLYLMLFALPITGWLMSSAKSYSVSWFNLVVLPDFVTADESMAHRFEQMHEFLAEALFVIALLHILAALKHWLIDKDGVMQRMASRSGIGILILTVVAALIVFGRVELNQGADKSASTEPIQTPLESANSKIKTKNSQLPLWQVDYADSYIKFTGDQAGAPFEGQWQNWKGELQFDPNELDNGLFQVEIDIASVASGDDERDGYIVGEDFFNQATYAQATFIATEFEKTESGYAALGQLTMKDISHPTKLEFQLQRQGERVTLNGNARLDRLAWGIGLGDWQDTTWVGQYVDVTVQVSAEVSF